MSEVWNLTPLAEFTARADSATAGARHGTSMIASAILRLAGQHLFRKRRRAEGNTAYATVCTVYHPACSETGGRYLGGAMTLYI